MNVLVIGGGGLQGRAAAYDLVHNDQINKVVLGDRSKKSLEDVACWLNSQKCKIESADCGTKDDLLSLIKKEDIDILVCSVPWKHTLPPLDAAIDAGIDCVDFGLYQNVEFDERIDQYNEKAKKAGITLVPSCGLAPGITNIVAANGASKLDKADTIQVYVGGNPEKPEPPLYYKTVWSIEGVWTQFMEACRIILDGKPATVEATTELEPLEFEGVGNFEAAYTDGLGTLLHTYNYPILKGVKNVYEKTMRWPGHYAKIRTFKDCGLLSNQPLEINGSSISPRDYLTALLDPMLKMNNNQRDMVTLRVNAIGEKGGKQTTHTYEMVDYKDTETGITSMARTTGFTGAIVVDMLGKGMIKDKGVVVPEQIGADEDMFNDMMTEFKKRNINIKKR